MFQRNIVEKIKTYILCSIFFFFYNREKNMVQPGGHRWQ